MGRLDTQTGISTYVQAVESLRKKYQAFTFLVIGAGPEKKKILRKQVKITGFIKDPERYFASYT